MGLTTPKDRIDDLCRSYDGSAASVLGTAFLQMADPMHTAQMITPGDHALAYALNLAAALRALQEAAPVVRQDSLSGAEGTKWRNVDNLIADLHLLFQDLKEKPN